MDWIVCILRRSVSSFHCMKIGYIHMKMPNQLELYDTLCKNTLTRSIDKIHFIHEKKRMVGRRINSKKKKKKLKKEQKKRKISFKNRFA